MRSTYSPAFSTSAIRSPKVAAGKWNIELLLRYAAATATTWIALAGAQLIVPTTFVLALGILSLLGVPLSLYLRQTDMHIGRVSVPRPLWNGLTVVGSGVIGLIFMMPTISDMAMMWHSEPQNFWLRFGGGDSLGLLMQAFLVFAALRSFAIISDKDATYTTIPSFSVLLLLIPVHKGIEVVCYFLAWTVVAAVLFALDHRSELSTGVIARVPSPIPGQDVRLAARSLLTVLGISLVAAIGVSIYLTSRDPEDRSEAETAITSLAARLTQFALSLPDGSVNSGPERQIDFSSGPNLPSRAELWRAQALSINRRPLHPQYWRLFSLSVYNGSSWAQASGRQRSLKRTNIDWIRRDAWFSFQNGDFGGRGGDIGRRGDFRGGIDPRSSGRVRNDFNSGRERFPFPWPIPDPVPSRPIPNGRGASDPAGSSPNAPNAGRPLSDEERRRIERDQFRGTGARPDFAPFPNPVPSPSGIQLNRELKPVPGYPGVYSREEEGFKVGQVSPKAHQYGSPRVLTRVTMRAQNANLGYIPNLPGASVMRFWKPEQNEVRVNFDGAIDLGVMQANEWAGFTGNVPQLAEYGYRGGRPPLKQVPAGKDTPVLDTVERNLNLRLPPTVTPRTREFGAQVIKSVAKDENNYSRAQALARAVQENAVYTLRPPAVPDGRDATDFFLFDGSKRGYCTYFAGALTVLCRTQGIPARVVSGFASDEYSGDGWAILRDANAHAWTEVWVDNWGWAIVDATPEDDRGDNAPTWIESWGDWLGATLDSTMRNMRAQWPLLAVIVVGAMLLVVRWKRVKSQRRSRSGHAHPEMQRREIVALYERMSNLLARRFRPRASWETPDEWLAAAEASLPHLPVESLRLLTQLYLQAQFSPRPLADKATQQAQDAVHVVRQFQWRQKTA